MAKRQKADIILPSTCRQPDQGNTINPTRSVEYGNNLGATQTFRRTKKTHSWTKREATWERNTSETQPGRARPSDFVQGDVNLSLGKNFSFFNCTNVHIYRIKLSMIFVFWACLEINSLARLARKLRVIDRRKHNSLTERHERWIFTHAAQALVTLPGWREPFDSTNAADANWL